MKMKIRKNILKIVATGIATGLAFSVSCWSVAASDSTNEAKAEETQEYDALQKIFLEINKETTEDKLLKLIEEHSVEYTAEEYNGTPKSRNYNIAFDSDVVLQKYAESGDSLEVSFNKEDGTILYAEYFNEASFRNALYYNYGTYWDFREDELDNTYTGYYYYKPGDTKGGITMKYDNGNSKETGKDFPALPKTDYTVRYVHRSMQEYLSPAFYLTPPLDTRTPNIIYINPSDQRSNLELFTTLSHEGFPGHLYQTIFFGNTEPSDIRYLITSSGYIEGWATYIESYGYQYASNYLDDNDGSDYVCLTWLNRSINLCIYSLLDIGIHYYGWSQDEAARLLKLFGITNTNAISEIYQYIVETPANYLKYCWGYLCFLDLKTEWQTVLGNNFNPKAFHQYLLEIGPVQFPVLQKYMQKHLQKLTAKENGHSAAVNSDTKRRCSYLHLLLFSVIIKKSLQFQQCFR